MPHGSIHEEEIMRFQRFSVAESSAGTYTELEIPTNLSLERGVIWQMHFVEILVAPDSFDDVAAGGDENVVVQITRESKSSLVNFNDADMIFYHIWEISRTAAIGTDAGPLYWYWQGPTFKPYSPPLLYANQNIYVAVDSTMAAVVTVRGRIGYTLAHVDEKLFFRVAQALIG